MDIYPRKNEYRVISIQMSTKDQIKKPTLDLNDAWQLILNLIRSTIMPAVEMSRRGSFSARGRSQGSGYIIKYGFNAKYGVSI